MIRRTHFVGCISIAVCAAAVGGAAASAQVRAWREEITLPTYGFESDVNPKFWALERGHGSIVYPYTMQDHLSRTQSPRTYRALFLENEYLKVTCLPELGGRLHSVLDKTQNKQMFYLNRVIKPSMIAMRGAWVSGGVEWNAGPQGHTVTCVTPVDGLTGENRDGSAFIEIGNLEQSQRTRWTVRVTLHPGRAYLAERIRLFNPTDAMSPYYFWNCTAFPNLPGTRFIFPMTLGTDHGGSKFFSWPMHEGRDLSWLRNFERSTSVFAVNCTFDFFGAYDVDLDRGIVQTADHKCVGGKKAWTWGTWDFGRVCQENLTDQDGPYIEVQSGPLPTQSDYGALWPRDSVSWQEWWYPVHGLGDGFEFANRDVAVQTDRREDGFEVRILATGRFPNATCTLSNERGELLEQRVDLTPLNPEIVTLSPPPPPPPVRILIRAVDGSVLASFESPLPIPKIDPPTGASPSAPRSVEETYSKGRKADLASDHARAREHYEQVLAVDADHVAALRGLAVLEIESGLYREAGKRLERAVERDPTDGLSWYFLGVANLQLASYEDTLRCARQAARCRATVSLGHDLAGRVFMRRNEFEKAVAEFRAAAESNPGDVKAADHLLMALYANRGFDEMMVRAESWLERRPSDMIPGAIRALGGSHELAAFARKARSRTGDDFRFIEASLAFADLGLFDEAARLLRSTCVNPLPEADRNPLVLHYCAWFAALDGDERAARAFLSGLKTTSDDFVFPSRPKAIEALTNSLRIHPDDARTHLHLGNVLGHLGRLEEALDHWQTAGRLDESLSIAFRNLGVYARAVEKDLPAAAAHYRRAIAARPQDQTLFRDLAEILTADGKRAAAIALIESMLVRGTRRADVSLALAGMYVDEKRFSEAIKLLDNAPYFVNWEGDSLPWVLFNRAHVGRGRRHLDDGRPELALADFEKAITYPDNLGVGRSDKPQHANAHYGRGRSLHALGRLAQALAAWRKGAAGSAGSEQESKHRQLCRDALDEHE